MYILNPYISEDDIRILHDSNLLKRFAGCSGNVILARVIDYINYGKDQEVIGYLKDAYAGRIMDDKLVNDKQSFTLVSEVTSYSYEDVNPVKSLEELIHMRDNIIEITSSEYSSKPYVKPIDKNAIESIIVDLTGLFRLNGDKRYKNLAFSLSSIKNMFSDKRDKGYSGTAYKPVYKNKHKLDLIVYGLNFLINEKEAGHKPESWRVF